MELKKYQNLLQLWRYSFEIAARIWWRAAVGFILFLALGQILSLFMRFLLGFFGIGLLLGGSRSSVFVVLIGLGLIVFAVMQLFTSYFWATGIHLIGQAIRQEKISLLEAFSNSFGAAWSLFVKSFCTTLVLLPGGLLIHKMPPAGYVLTAVVFFLVVIRWTYAQGYIVLHEYGGIEAMRESWDLTRHNYGDTILLWLILILSYAVYMALFVLVFYVTGKPLLALFSRSVIITVVGGGMFGIMLSQLFAFVIVAFVNRDAVANPRLSPQEVENFVIEEPEIVTPVPPQVKPAQEQKPPQMDKIDL